MLRGAARSRLHVARFARSARLPARSLSSSTPPPPPPPDKTPDKPEVPDSAFLFRMTNPELFMDPNKRSNWYIVAGVWAFFAAYIGWTYWRVDLPAQRAKEAAPLRRPAWRTRWCARCPTAASCCATAAYVDPAEFSEHGYHHVSTYYRPP